jgi:DNA-binding beta-propeller fold protein YncE
LAAVLVSIFVAGCSHGSTRRVPAATTGPVHHYLYDAVDGAVVVYDIDNGNAVVKTVKVPQMITVRGVAASAATGVLYVSYNGKVPGQGSLLAYDLLNDAVVWTRAFHPLTDSLCVTPNGRTIYMASGEATTSTSWFVLDAATGAIRTTIDVGATNTHDTVCSLDGRHAFLAAVSSPVLDEVETATNQIIKRIGPFAAGLRPYTINGKQTLAYVNVNHLLGFQIADLTTGTVLRTVAVPGYTDDGSQVDPSHGVALAPDERRVWVVDGEHQRVHVFDVSGVPSEPPALIATVAVSGPAAWVNVDLGGRFAYISTGDVISTSTLAIVGRVAPSYRQLEVDFAHGAVVATSANMGLGRVTS